MAEHRRGALTIAVAVAAFATFLTVVRCDRAPPSRGRAANECSALVASPFQTPPPVDPNRPVMGFDTYNTLASPSTRP